MARFFHIRTVDFDHGVGNKGGRTVAFVVSEDQQTIRFAVAKCSPRDNFCRRIGRAISLGRLQGGGTTLDLNGRDVYTAILEHLGEE